MTTGFQPRTFWRDRFRTYGHTGEVDRQLYAYDQPRRLRAIEHALALGGVRVDGRRVLDVGCGTGDLVDLLLQLGHPQVVGIDLSDETIEYARQRFHERPEVAFRAVGLEEADFASDSFDLACAVNVLQHILSEPAFSGALDNLVRMVKPAGHLLSMDFSPLRAPDHQPAPYLIIRSRDAYIQAFEKRGCRLVLEYGLPRIGVRLYRALTNVLVRLKGRPAAAGASPDAAPPPAPPRVRRGPGYWLRAGVLGLAAPFDRWLAPAPPGFTDMRILLFQKGTR